MGYFDLERKKDGLYRCKGGHLADILLLGGGVIYCFILWVLSPFAQWRDKMLGK